MSRSIGTFLVAVVTFSIGNVGVADALADQLLQQGDPIGVFHVKKVAGANDDGVEPGEELCYRCRYGSRPIVMVFARTAGEELVELVRKINASVQQNESSNLSGVVTLLGDDAASVEKEATQLAGKSKATHVPVVIAKEIKTGPLSYRIPAEADITIVLARESQVVSASAYQSGQLDVDSILSDVKQMLN